MAGRQASLARPASGTVAGTATGAGTAITVAGDVLHQVHVIHHHVVHVSSPEVRAQCGRPARLAAILDRDGASCIWCSRPLGGLVRATTEHLVPRVKGGPTWLENEVAAGRRCNAERGHVSPAERADEWERRGWPVDRERLLRELIALHHAIADHGGQRRVRRYLASQLRRLSRNV